MKKKKLKAPIKRFQLRFKTTTPTTREAAASQSRKAAGLVNNRSDIVLKLAGDLDRQASNFSLHQEL